MLKKILIFCLVVNSTISLKAQLLESNLPILVFTSSTLVAGDPNIEKPKVPGTIEIYDNPLGQTNKLTDKPAFKYTIGIEYRGSSSQYFPKRSLGFETRNDKGENLNIKLLGMPVDNDWVLIAPYSDKSLIRDPLSYSLARKMGRYASRTKLVEIILNGDYYGVGFLGEKLKQGKERVNVSNLKNNENSGDAVTGGYIIKIDKNTGAPSKSWSSNFSAGLGKPYFQVEYPKLAEITSQQFNYIKNYVYEFEDRLFSSDFRDDEKGYKKLADIDSFVDYFLINEVTRNVDGYRLSTYFYKDKDSKNGKLTMGPAWDYNLAFGNADYCDGWKTTGWAYQFNDVCPQDGAGGVPFWWNRLLQDNKFQAKLKSRWKDLRTGVWSNSKILAEIDSSANLLKDAQKRNFQRWPILGKYVWPNKFIANNYTEEINFTREWLISRLAWMDDSYLLNADLLAEESPLLDTERLTVYPNPIARNTKISFGLLQTEQVEASIWDLTGKKLKTIVYQKLQKGSYEFPLQAENLSPGAYIISLEKDNKNASYQKIIVN